MVGAKRSIRFGAAGLAVLGSGAFALPSSKIAFLQHGVVEGEDAVMHPPSTLSSKLASLTPQLLSSAISRVMSLDARAEVDTGLPAGDIFNRPDGNVLVFVDGLRASGESEPERTKELRYLAADAGYCFDGGWLLGFPLPARDCSVAVSRASGTWYLVRCPGPFHHRRSCM